MANVGQGPAVELLYNLPPEHGLPTLMGNWVEERALDALTGVPRHQECVKPLVSKTTVFAQRQDKRNFEPTFPRVFGPGNSAAQLRTNGSATSFLPPAAPLEASTASALHSAALQATPATTLMRDSYRPAEGHLADNMRNSSVDHRGQRQAKELAQLLAYANAAVSYQEAVDATPPPLDYTTTQHVAHDAKDMSDIRQICEADELASQPDADGGPAQYADELSSVLSVHVAQHRLGPFRPSLAHGQSK
ncbi:hypothetical protein WJX74_003203 [Apatococcus lobatus]|uniref:Uncharacterized protein n=1 Tax=Apatococcus lobatus TaxID=904363 RepID=A0AAW1RME2_9CHLO